MQGEIAIVVTGYNRPFALSRLLKSIAVANYEGYKNIQLIISLDYHSNEDCVKLAEEFQWLSGEKEVVKQQYKLGLKSHILQCGSLSAKYDAIILLEDDLLVSPFFYSYAQQAYGFYKDASEVAGIALYNNTFNETALCPFEPVHDGFDNYFMQVPCSWGQLWTSDQWSLFIDYFNKGVHFTSTDNLPDNVLYWPTETSWKKAFFKFLVDTNKYFVYPRIALSTNFGDAGSHLTTSINVFQTPLLNGHIEFRFSTFDQSKSIYDSHSEIEGVKSKLYSADESITFDLNGTKKLSKITTRYLYSSKSCISPEKKYSASLYPYENNIFYDVQHRNDDKFYFSFGETKNFSDEKLFERKQMDSKRLFLHQDDNGEVIQTRENMIGYQRRALKIKQQISSLKHWLRKL